MTKNLNEQLAALGAEWAELRKNRDPKKAKEFAQSLPIFAEPEIGGRVVVVMKRRPKGK